MARQLRGLVSCGLFLLAAGLFSCQGESDFSAIPLDEPTTTVLAGTIRTAGAPLANAIVTLEPVVDGLPLRVRESLSGRWPADGMAPASVANALAADPGVRAAVSDERGRYAFPAIEPGNFQIEVRGRDHLGATRRINIPPLLGALAETTLVDIQLTPTGDYYGTVTLETASSHQGSLVYVDGTSHVAVTDPAGGYVIGGVPVGSHLVRAVHPGYLDRTVGGMLAAAGDSVLLTSLVLPRDSNIAPVAVAGAPTDTIVGVPTGFSGTGTDKDGVIVRYEWDFDDDGTFDYTSPTTATTTHTFNLSGTYRARLRVLDDDGAIGVDVVSFNIVEDGIFVATGGSDLNPGTSAAPVQTITQGIALAQAAGVDVRVAGGTYNESLVLVTGVSIVGGYNPLTWVRDLPNQLTRVVGAATAVQGNSVSNVELDGLRIESANASTPGQSSYGLSLVQCQAITIRDCSIRGGRGANGTAGINGTSGSGGASGSPGQPGCENGGAFCESCSLPSGGLRGVGSYGPTDISGGNGGVPGLGSGVGSSGQPGQGPSPGSGGPGSPCSPSCNGQAGQPGQPGAAGFDGPGGTSFGSATLGGYQVSSGGAGSVGQPGSGGGGGGGGSGGTATCDSYGSSGGGGGAGGQPGTAATNGTGGGGSFAIWMVNCTGVTVTGCLLETVGGGNGGAGGTGGSGGTGGAGGPGGPYGGSSEQDDGGMGAAGGTGGTGGRGGHGGGGGGGPSIGIAVTATTGFSHSGSSFLLGVGGPGGASSGFPGATGVVQNVRT